MKQLEIIAKAKYKDNNIMSDKKKTAVEFLIKEISDILGVIETSPMQNLLLTDATIKAKEMEREQMIDIHIGAMKMGLIRDDDEWKEKYLPKITEVAETYYKETYGE